MLRIGLRNYEKMITFVQGLKYPFGRPVRLLNILWGLVPVLGFFAILAYMQKIINEIVKGKTKEVPKFGNFWQNTKAGFYLFIRALPIILSVLILFFLLLFMHIFGWLMILLLGFFILPLIFINYMVKETIGSSYDIENSANAVSDNFLGYIKVMLKTFLYVLVCSLLSVVIIGIPLLVFGKFIYIADFYRNYEKKKKTLHL